MCSKLSAFDPRRQTWCRAAAVRKKSRRSSRAASVRSPRCRRVWPRPEARDGSRTQPPQRHFSSGVFACSCTAGDVPATTRANPGGSGRNPSGSVGSAQDAAGFQMQSGKTPASGGTVLLELVADAAFAHAEKPGRAGFTCSSLRGRCGPFRAPGDRVPRRAETGGLLPGRRAGNPEIEKPRAHRVCAAEDPPRAR